MLLKLHRSLVTRNVTQVSSDFMYLHLLESTLLLLHVHLHLPLAEESSDKEKKTFTLKKYTTERIKTPYISDSNLKVARFVYI